MVTALDGVLVVDLTSAVTGGVAGKLLADLGAEVVMLEPTTGGTFRAHGLFEHLAGGKRSVVPGDDGAATTWLAAADVVLTDGSSGWHDIAVSDRRDTDRPRRPLAVRPLRPLRRLGGQRSRDWAMGGYLYFTGSPDREPIWVPGPQAQFHAGAHAAFAALVGLYERERSGRGQAVEIAELDATLTAHAWLVSSWAACGQLLGPPADGPHPRPTAGSTSCASCPRTSCS